MSQQLPASEIAWTLDLLSALKEAREEVLRAHAAAKEALLSPALRRRMQQLETAFQADLRPIEAQIDVQEELIRAATLSLGQTVRGQALMAVYNGGRITWNTAALDGFIAAGHPELAPFRQAGAPSVSLRPIVARGGALGQSRKARD